MFKPLTCASFMGMKGGSGMSDEKKPMTVRCGSCDHEWAAVYLPMPLTKVVALVQALFCPKCGQDSKAIFIKVEEDRNEE
jgi:Zn finger protein HypA/HybF involved in hydrogenase expression